MAEFNIEDWMCCYAGAVKDTFLGRIWFLGLQGSYGRGEAAAHSDIDVVLILDTVSCQELCTYSELLETLPHREKVCGFVSGRGELEAWEKAELFQFCCDTVPVIGSLEDLLQTIAEHDVKRAIRSGCCNLYHACVHNLVHEKNGDILKSLYKSAMFTLQAIVYLQKGSFIKKQGMLFPLLEPEERCLAETRRYLQDCKVLSDRELTVFSDQLLQWTSNWILKMK